MSKKEIIIHGGLHKTGTSAIQYFLSKNRSILLSQGYEYPETGKHHAHHDFFAKFKNQDNKQEIEELIHKLSNTGNKLILSSELLCEEDFYLPFLKIFNKYFDTVSFVFYVRRQDLLIESAYCEIVKYGIEKRDLNTFTPYIIDINKRLRIIQENSDKAQVKAFEFDKNIFIDNSLIHDFCHRVLKLDCDLLNYDDLIVNPSISCISALIMAKINSTDYDRRLLPKIIELLNLYFPKNKYAEFTILSLKYYERILEMAIKSNVDLKENFLCSGNMSINHNYNRTFISWNDLKNYISKGEFLENLSSLLQINIKTLNRIL